MLPYRTKSLLFLISVVMVDNRNDMSAGDGFIDSQLIVLSGVGPKISCTFPTPIELDHARYDYKIGLKKFKCYYAFPNVTENVNNKLAIRPGTGKDFVLIALPTGAYEIDSIFKAILTELKNKKIDIKGKGEETDYFILGTQLAEFKVQITLRQGWAVKFNVEHSIAAVLGFDKTPIIDAPKITTAPHTVKILVFNSMFFLTDITYPSIFNGKYIPFLFHYSLHTAPGYNIVVTPNDVTYKSLTTNILSHINLWVIDEHGHNINFNTEELTVELKLIRKLRHRKRTLESRFVLDNFG